jgi:CBS domain-containing protein
MEQRLSGPVAEVMLRHPRVHAPSTTVAEVRAMFADEHIHCALVVDADRLLGVIERDDLVTACDRSVAVGLGRLTGRTIAPEAELAAVHQRMVAEHVRRLAVIDDRGRLLGLLCLNRKGRGFCSDEDVAARAAATLSAGPVG